MDIILDSPDGERHETTLAEFLKDNAETMHSDEIAEICRALTAGETYTSGGGAAPEWGVEPAPGLAGPSDAAAANRSAAIAERVDETVATRKDQIARLDFEIIRREQGEPAAVAAAFGAWYMDTIPPALQPAVESWSRLLREAFEAGAKAGR